MQRLAHLFLFSTKHFDSNPILFRASNSTPKRSLSPHSTAPLFLFTSEPFTSVSTQASSAPIRCNSSIIISVPSHMNAKPLLSFLIHCKPFRSISSRDISFQSVSNATQVLCHTTIFHSIPSHLIVAPFLFNSGLIASTPCHNLANRRHSNSILDLSPPFCSISSQFVAIPFLC